MLFMESVILELVGGHIGIMLYVVIENLEFPGGQLDKGESNSNISISINSIKTIWPPENRIFDSLPFWACWLSYI